jgi:hypothetical protein
VNAIYSVFGKDPRYVSLAMCESGLRADAVGYDASHNQYNYGIFQVSQYHGWSYNYLVNPLNNAKVAKIIWDRQGPGAWPVCSRKVGLA